MLGLISVSVAQAADVALDTSIDSRDIFDTRSMISDNPVLRAGISASFNNGWCGSITGAVDLDNTSRTQKSATVCHDWKFGTIDVSAGLTYFDVWNENAYRPYIKANIPVFNENWAVFAKAQRYYAENDADDGNVFTVGGSYKHPLMGSTATHNVSFTRNRTSYAGSNIGDHAMYQVSLEDIGVFKSTKVTPTLWIVDEENRRSFAGVGVNLTHNF